jgi:branched-chain amino acid transport system ATP-binding protein
MTGLVVTDLSVDYGNGIVLKDVGFSVEPGEILVVLGPNGAGKTTLLRTIAGLVPAKTGSVTLGGVSCTRHSAGRRARSGLLLVPEGRGLFPSIPVQAHLTLAGRKRVSRAVLQEIAETFPALGERWKVPAGALSGGEAQMLAMAMAFVARPDVLLIDELSFGLAPLVVRDLLDRCRSLADQRGTSIVLVEQYMDLALEIADRALLLRGEVLLQGSASEVAAQRELVGSAYLGGMGAA